MSVWITLVSTIKTNKGLDFKKGFLKTSQYYLLRYPLNLYPKYLHTWASIGIRHRPSRARQEVSTTTTKFVLIAD